MSNYWENDNYVRDLQKNALTEMGKDESDQRTNKGLAGSRTAMLALIDRLSRRAVRQLSIVVIAIFSLAAFYSLNLPHWTLNSTGRLICWLGLSLGVLGYLTRLLFLFREGIAFNGRPFSWRSQYTAYLSVISVCLGASAFFLTPEIIAPSNSFVIYGGIAVFSLALGLGHLSHRPAALSASIPGLFLSSWASLLEITNLPAQIQVQYYFIWAVSLLFYAGVFFFGKAQSTRIISEVLQRHPRHEMNLIKARKKKTTAAYNPYSRAAQRTSNSR